MNGGTGTIAAVATTGVPPAPSGQASRDYSGVISMTVSHS